MVCTLEFDYPEQGSALYTTLLISATTFVTMEHYHLACLLLHVRIPSSILSILFSKAAGICCKLKHVKDNIIIIDILGVDIPIGRY